MEWFFFLFFCQSSCAVEINPRERFNLLQEWNKLMWAPLIGRSAYSLGEEVMLLITDSQKANKLQVVGHFKNLQFLLQLKCCWLNLPTSMFLGGSSWAHRYLFFHSKGFCKGFSLKMDLLLPPLLTVVEMFCLFTGSWKCLAQCKFCVVECGPTEYALRQPCSYKKKLCK